MTDADIQHLIGRLSAYTPDNHQGVRAPYELCDKVRTALFEWLAERDLLRKTYNQQWPEIEDFAFSR